MRIMNEQGGKWVKWGKSRDKDGRSGVIDT